jgi:hypothetical protein
MGELFARGDCEALYIADQAVPSGYYEPDTIWLLVERAPNTPVCRSLITAASSIPFETRILAPSNLTTVSESKLLLIAEASSSGRSRLYRSCSPEHRWWCLGFWDVAAL